LEASLGLHLSGKADRPRPAAPTPVPPQSRTEQARLWLRGPARVLRQAWRRPFIRRTTYAAAGAAVALGLAFGALVWRLGNGPISLDLATPWLAAAVEQNFGPGRRVEVGGTQIERDEHGRISVRLRDVVVRDADGTVVASAPKAEVGVSGTGLLTGTVRAERLSLVGAGLSLRIESDGNLTVFAGAESRPIATASASTDSLPTSALKTSPEGVAPPARDLSAGFAALLAWIDGLGATGLDGHDLDEVGLKSGKLVVDDQRSGKRWSFDSIDFSLTRPKTGGVLLKLGSGGSENPWSLSASVGPTGPGRRTVHIEADKVPVRDLLLAARMDDGQIDAQLPLSMRLAGDIGPDGQLHYLRAQVVADRGYIADVEEGRRLVIDRAEVGLEWDAERRSVRAPVRLVSEGNRFNFIVQGAAPDKGGDSWRFALSHGAIILAPTFAGDETLVLDQMLARVRVDTARRRAHVEQFEVGNAGLKVTLGGHVDYATSDSRMVLGLAANSMSMTTLKRLWPNLIAPKTRAWIHERITAGDVERVVIATNMPLSALGGTPIPDDGLSVEIATTATEIYPVEALPAIRDADLNMQVKGRAATIALGRGIIDLPSGRKLTMTNGTFEVPDTSLDVPMSRTRFRLDGPVPAAAEFLATEKLRDTGDIPLDPATSRGTVSAQVTLGVPLLREIPKGSTTYTVAMDVANFAAERMVMGHKVEAAALRVTANAGGYQIRGDVKVNGLPATLDYRKVKGEPDAEMRIQATLDDAARTRFGLDAGNTISGPVPVKLAGRAGGGERESRFTVEADLSQATIDNLLPGWVKPAGKPTRASFVLVGKPQSTRFEDLLIDGSGALVKGSIEIDDGGEIVSANFPVFGVSDGDKAALKADRSSDGVLRVTLRGDVYDGRALLKSAMAGTPQDQKAKRKTAPDIDLDVKLGIVAGHHGETLRSLDLRLGRRNGQIRNFLLSAKLGRDTPLTGDLRTRGPGGRHVLFVETNDAGALFRLTDTYARIGGGRMWVAMDPPAADQAPQDGTLNIQDFVVRGEAALDRVATGGNSGNRGGVEFNRLRVEFTKQPGRLMIRDGLVRGPVIGATIDGTLDYARDEVRLRGTFVPLYGINNMFGQIPIVGMFLGGSNEGLVGITYEVVGAPSAPVLRVNPISAVAPGVFRKFFEFPSGNSRSAAEPQR
jgi:hypothetical protein